MSMTEATSRHVSYALLVTAVVNTYLAPWQFADKEMAVAAAIHYLINKKPPRGMYPSIPELYEAGCFARREEARRDRERKALRQCLTG